MSRSATGVRDQERGAWRRRVRSGWSTRSGLRPPARTGGNLCRAELFTCALKGARRDTRTRLFSRPMVSSKTLPPRLSLCRETLRSPDMFGGARSVEISRHTMCRSPRKRGGGPRVLGRAARLIEGPKPHRACLPSVSLSLSIVPSRTMSSRGRESGETATGRDCIFERKKAFSMNAKKRLP